MENVYVVLMVLQAIPFSGSTSLVAAVLHGPALSMRSGLGILARLAVVLLAVIRSVGSDPSDQRHLGWI